MLADKKYNLLYVEDDPEDQVSFRAFCRDNLPEIELTLCDSVQATQELLDKETFDIIISDYYLGDGTGFEVIKMAQNIPVVIVTGAGDEKTAINALKNGAYDYLIKDIESSYLKLLPITLDNVFTRKETEDQIEKLSIAVSKIDNSVIIADNEGRIEWVNEGFTRITGYTLKDVKGTHGEVLRRGAKTPLSDPKYFNKLIRKKESIIYEAKNYTKTGKIYWVYTQITPIKNKNGEVEKVVAVDADITEKKKTERELIQAKHLAEKSVKAKEQFLANVSHEIRTPMNAIMGMLHLLKEANLNEKEKNYLNTISQSSENLMVIINDLLDISKIEAGKFTLEETEFELDKLIDSLITSLQYRVNEKGIYLKANIDDKISRILIGDPVRINQILTNLVGNSIKFTEQGGVTIDVTLAEKNNEEYTILFSIKDTGIGIPKEKLSSIFESFTQASSDTTRKFGGTGLGLTISQQLVELMEGKIDVTSEVGKGSTFSFELTFQKGDPANLVQQDNIEEGLAVQQLPASCILLVDDNKFNQEVITDLIHSKNNKIDIDIAETGQEAITMISDNNYQLVLMDIQMPVMDGHEATRFIRSELDKQKKTIPIVAITAHASSSQKEKCMESGMNDYLSKPIKPQALYNAIVNNINLSSIPKRKPVKKEENTTSEENTTNIKTEKLYDLSFFKNFAEGNTQMLLKYINLFIEKIPKEVDNLEGHLEKENWEQIQSIAHSVKPQFNHMATVKLEKLAIAIEDEAKNQSPKAKKLQTLLNELKENSELVLTELKKEK
ncbi:MAG: response regulator, partial [Bacteroidia bacterium]|nr:response regulator [Bacteroidia bacterium]